MKPFVFSLQDILELREFEQNQAEIELGKANQEVARIQKELENVALQVVSSRNAVKESKNLYSIINASNYDHFLDLKKEKLLEELAQANLVAEEKKNAFLEAMKKQTALETMRDMELNDWKEEKKNEENKFIDDIVIAKYNKSDDS